MRAWRLGDHVLACGDATDPAVVRMVCDHADLLLTDPPYGVARLQHRDGSIGAASITKFGPEGKLYSSQSFKPVAGNQNTDTARAAWSVAKPLTDNAVIFGGNYFSDFLPPSKCWIVWNKKTKGFFADCELAWTNLRSVSRLIEWRWAGMLRKGDRKDELIRRIHPNQKPVGVMAWILETYTKPGAVILDPFGGSGSTLIACEKTGRKCRMIELDEDYCLAIVNRWETYTGLKAEEIALEEEAAA